MNESVDTFIDKVDKISETGEIVDFHKWVYFLCFSDKIRGVSVYIFMHP